MRTDAQYIVTTEDQRAYIVSIVVYESSDAYGIYNINITEQEEYTAATTPTGSITNMNGATPIQWIFLALAAAAYGFSIWMFIDCIRHRIKRKWLWILLILLVYFGITLTVQPNSIRLNFSVLLTTYSRVLIYPTGGMQINLGFPLGALIYLVLRRRLYPEKEPVPMEKSFSEPLVVPQEGPAAEKIATGEAKTETQDTMSGSRL